ncbi:RES domain-containing protein [Leptolyngbya sp. 15MV]|nr:RES domain-containing protein [Leptolyngbya sp. 15MV]
MSRKPDFEGKLYRALNPVWADKPLSGDGAATHGGRFNPRGMAALYCSLGPLAALREANQVGDLQPTTLVSYNAVIARVLDATDEAAIGKFGLTLPELAAPDWRDQMLRDGIAPTQQLAPDALAKGYSGMVVRSFARGARDEDRNLVLWRWGPKLPNRLVLIDDENRLG